MATIRTATPADVARAEYICIETADKRLKSSARQAKITALLFSTYYITRESRHCFVLEEAGEVVGYILCCTDLRAFVGSYCGGDIFRAVSKRSPLWGAVSFFVPAKYVLFSPAYPAHLHIDILESHQAAGYGSELMRTLLAHLKAEHIKGVCLSCGAGNTRAIRFYEKFGFRTKLTAFGGKIMAKKI
ncbi:MAG: GNAT family N-acetyltransferase [Ruminococcaceae bacterium]|nr:GNAT family N-acetyltransferase [Oscillospiraceae bacterium]